MAYNHEYPYFSADNANVDWFLDFVNRLHKEWEDMKKEWNNVLSEWDGMKNTWEEYRQELENRFGEFTTNITNQFGALRLEFTDLKEEFNALKTYVETQINNIPDDVKNIFQTYIDDGTILEMITSILPDVPEDLKEQVEKNKNDIAGLTASLATLTTQITNLTTKVNQNITDIIANAGNIAKNTTDIGNNKISIQNLTTTVGNHTTEISNIKTEQAEIMNDIANIVTLDNEQNNRLTDLENREISTQEHFWLLINRNLPNLTRYITNFITSFIETTILSAGFGEANTIINTTSPVKKPTRIIIIVDDNNISSDVGIAVPQISSIAETAKKKYPGVHVYVTSGPSPSGTINTIQKMSNILNSIAGFSSIIRNPFIHLCMKPVLASYPYIAKNNLGDFTSSHKIAYEYVLELFNSIFAPQFGDTNIVYNLPITLTLGTDSSGVGDMNLVLHNSYLEMQVEIEMPGGHNSNFDIAGLQGDSLLGYISGRYYPYVPRFIPSIDCILSFFSRDNRSSGSHSALIWFQDQSSSMNLTIGNRDFNATSIVNGYTIISRRFVKWSSTEPISA